MAAVASYNQLAQPLKDQASMAQVNENGEKESNGSSNHSSTTSYSQQALELAISYASSARQRYTKGELLGRGACKTVYKAFDESEGVERAWNEVSVSGEWVTMDERERDRIFAEIKLLKQLKHKNVLALYDYWFDKKTSSLVFITELFTDGSLRSYRRRHKNVDTGVIKRWAWQILQGLVYLHGHSPAILHRDLKCDNIFVNSSSGTLKIGDLGFATFRAGFSGAMSVIGTPEFMAPELYEERYDEKVDIYSFGMCLLELATLEYPYSECRNAAQIFKKVTQGIPPQGLAKVQDDELREFIQLCIQQDPLKRPEARQLLKNPFFNAVRDSGLKSRLGMSFVGTSSVSTTSQTPPPSSASTLSLVTAGAQAPSTNIPLATPEISSASATTANNNVAVPSAVAIPAVHPTEVRRTPSTPSNLHHSSSVAVAFLPDAQTLIEPIRSSDDEHEQHAGPHVHTHRLAHNTRSELCTPASSVYGFSQPGSRDTSGGGTSTQESSADAPADHVSSQTMGTIAAAARNGVHSASGGPTSPTAGQQTTTREQGNSYLPSPRTPSKGRVSMDMNEDVLFYGDESGQSEALSTRTSAQLDRKNTHQGSGTYGAAGSPALRSPSGRLYKQRSRETAVRDNDSGSDDDAEESEMELGQRVRLACRNHHDNMLAFSMSFVNDAGTRKKVGFQYDMDADTAAEVASEMIENLSLNLSEAGFIANLIQKEIQKYYAGNGEASTEHSDQQYAAEQQQHSTNGNDTATAKGLAAKQQVQGWPSGGIPEQAHTSQPTWQEGGQTGASSNGNSWSVARTTSTTSDGVSPFQLIAGSHLPSRSALTRGLQGQQAQQHSSVPSTSTSQS